MIAGKRTVEIPNCDPTDMDETTAKNAGKFTFDTPVNGGEKSPRKHEYEVASVVGKSSGKATLIGGGAAANDDNPDVSK